MQKPLFSGIFGLGISKVIDTVDDNDIENKSTLVQNCPEQVRVPSMESKRFKGKLAHTLNDNSNI